jgi:peptidyl-tRNA hydrolase, PTH1 family
VPPAIIGLGNPGLEYRETRHNVGQRVVDALAHRVHARFEREGGHLVARAGWERDTLYLIELASFMNGSGAAVARLCDRLVLTPADLIIVFDDLDLPLGTVRVRRKGRAGGHNGVRSIIDALGTDAFRRVKVGIGRPAPPGQDKERVVDHVLSPFYPDERDAVEAACARAADLALQLAAEPAGC